MKRLKEMKKPCIRFLSIALMVIVAMALVAQPALAAKQHDNPLLDSRMEREYNRAINKLERYLSISETGNIVLDAPKGVVRSIDSEVYQSILAGLEQTNSLIDSGYLVANPDFTLTVTGDSVGGIQALSSSGGIDDFFPYWWGCWIYLSDATCDQLVYQLGIGSSATALTAIILAALGFTAPAGAIVAVVSLLLGLGATILGQYNVNNTGIKIRLHGYIIPTYIGPQ